MQRQFFVLLAVAIGLAAAGPTGDKLADRCGIKDNNLKTVEDLNAIVARASAAGSGCEPRVLQALNDMKAITDDPAACTTKKAEAITGYVDKYLKESGAVPKALADFAVAYGMQVSGVCSREMVDSFASKADALIYDRLGADFYDGYLNFKSFLLDESPVGLVLAPLIKTGEVILPADLMQAVPEVNAKLQVQLSKKDSFDKLQAVCVKLLQPLYEPTLLPLARLIKAGFVNRASLKSKEFKQNGRFWSSAVYLCESLKLIEVEVRDTAEQAALEAKVAEALNGLNKAELDREGGGGVQSAPIGSVPVSACLSSAEVGNKIVSSSVKPLVKAFEADKSEVERIRELIAARSMRLIRAMVKNGKFKTLFGEISNLIKIQDEAKRAEFEEAKQSLLRYIESPERETAALQRQVSGERNKFLTQRGDNESKQFHEGKCRRVFNRIGDFFGISILVLWKIVGSFVIIVYTLATLIPYVLILIFTAPFGSLEENSSVKQTLNSIDRFVDDISGWPEGLF